uniref:Pinin/SDK/MemA protein domain-containing protein n=1 Tax=Populus trichocarpa TaxID=3694 RepID=A0A3N7ELH0_POPTR
MSYIANNAILQSALRDPRGLRKRRGYSSAAAAAPRNFVANGARPRGFVRPKFRKEDMKISGMEAFIQRSNALQRAEQKAHEERERLRQQECEQIAEQRRRDLTLRARITVKAEEKKLELLFLRWNDHHKKLSNFIRLFLNFGPKVSIFTILLRQR